MALTYGLWLFTEGNGILSGYSIQKLEYNGDFARTDYIEWATTSQINTGNSFQFQPFVNFAKYNTLYVDLQCTSRYSGAQTTVVIAVTEKYREGESQNTDIWGTLQKIVIKNDPYNTNRHTVSVDVSNISNNYYVTIRAFGISGKIYNLWLE